MASEVKLDIKFDVRTDTPPGKDPDAYSNTLKQYHRLLWSKPLPNGQIWDLYDAVPGSYLCNVSGAGEYFLSSDSITHSYRQVKRMAPVVELVSETELDRFQRIGSTIGGYILFPAKRIDRKPTINGARGLNHAIGDRFDLTLECIRLYYKGERSPLYDCFERYRSFFSLFVDFNGYIDFFLLQDLVTTDCSIVDFYLPFDEFGSSPFPRDITEYQNYMAKSLSFTEARSFRMLSSLK